MYDFNFDYDRQIEQAREDYESGSYRVNQRNKRELAIADAEECGSTRPLPCFSDIENPF